MDKNQVFFQHLLDKHQSAQLGIDPEQVHNWVNDLLLLLFPVFSHIHLQNKEEIVSFHEELKKRLHAILLFKRPSAEQIAQRVSNVFFKNLPDLFQKMSRDLDAIYEGDPAARSREEILVAYPGFYAIAAYRIAHELHQAGIELIPRMISKRAHRTTGIDIHPAARIGSGFCIDHGTGIVIGETTDIGNCVKIYQGVTLGALSVDKKDAKKKRHPSIEDKVVIYAGATILGGKTVIGKGSIIGGNAWITESVRPYSKIYYQAQHIDVNGKEIKKI